MRKTIILILIAGVHLLWSQQLQEFKPSTYYLQKKTLFESLPDTENEIIFLGNSITDGCEWSELFQDLHIKNRGISADVTQGVLNRLSEVTESEPLQIFLMIGINDLAYGLSVGQVVKNYEQIIRKVQQQSPKTELLVQSVLPVNDAFPKFKNHVNKSKEIVALNVELRKICEKYNLKYIDLYSSFAVEEKLDPQFTNDGLHLTGPGYLLWKTEIEKYLK